MAEPAEEKDKTLSELPEAGGRTIGHYRLLRRLGAGGMGEVYLAEDITLKRQAAVKLLPPEVANDSAWRKRFLHEARTASALNHPSIATIYEAGTEGEIAYMAMEYVEGVTLRERLKRPLAVKEAAQLARQVAQALAVAHQAGVVHHDIKPANIMLPSAGGVKVLDFGLARRQRAPADQGETLTASLSVGGISGTPGYAAPEQLQPGLAGREAGATEKTDARVDLFALGTVLYEMLAGRPAFQGENLFELCHAVLTQAPAPVESLRKETPAALARIVAACLEKEPSSRYQCAADLARDLEWAAASEAPRPEPARPAARLHSPWLLAAAVLIGIALGASALLWRRPPRAYWKLVGGPPKQVVRHSGIILEAGLAPDGTQFAYVFENELYLQALGGGEPRKLTSDGFAKEWPRLSPDGNRLIFERVIPAEKGSREKRALYALNLPAGIPRLLVEDASKGEWSPDGGKLSFIRPSAKEAFVADADGKQPRSLGPVSRAIFGISWDGDGKNLAIVYKEKVYIVSADGRSRKELPGLGGSPQDRVLGADFTPDGNFLLVDRPTGGMTHQLYQVPVRGGPLVPFLVGRYDVCCPTISRDGKKLLAVLARWEIDIVISEPAGEAAPGKFRKITTTGDAMSSEDVALSPDEKRIAYLRWRGAGQWDLWVVHTDGTDPRQITMGAKPKDPAWSPDGKTIVFGAEKQQLWTIRLDEGTPRQFSSVEGEKSHASYTADGKHLVFGLNRSGKSDIWLAPVEGGQGRPLTSDGVSKMPRAAPVGPVVAYLRQTSASTAEIRIVDYIRGRDRVLLTSQEESKFGKLRLDVNPLRWSRDGQYLFVSAEFGLLRIKAQGGSPEKFSFPVEGTFDVFSDYRKIVFSNETRDFQPWLYDDLQ